MKSMRYQSFYSLCRRQSGRRELSELLTTATWWEYYQNGRKWLNLQPAVLISARRSQEGILNSGLDWESKARCFLDVFLTAYSIPPSSFLRIQVGQYFSQCVLAGHWEHWKRQHLFNVQEIQSPNSPRWGLVHDLSHPISFPRGPTQVPASLLLSSVGCSCEGSGAIPCSSLGRLAGPVAVLRELPL